VVKYQRGMPIFLRDVAEVGSSASSRCAATPVSSGRPAVILGVQKQPGADTIGAHAPRRGRAR
jgi:multidrug efflux pump subunit AcrB